MKYENDTLILKLIDSLSCKISKWNLDIRVGRTMVWERKWLIIID